MEFYFTGQVRDGDTDTGERESGMRVGNERGTSRE